MQDAGTARCRDPSLAGLKAGSVCRSPQRRSPHEWASVDCRDYMTGLVVSRSDHRLASGLSAERTELLC